MLNVIASENWGFLQTFMTGNIGFKANCTLLRGLKIYKITDFIKFVYYAVTSYTVHITY